MKRKEALRYSIRISGSVTSISLRRNLVSLWLVLNVENISNMNNLHGLVQNFIYSCLSKWKENNGKGFSDFVSEMMIRDILERKDFKKYKQIFEHI